MSTIFRSFWRISFVGGMGMRSKMINVMLGLILGLLLSAPVKIIRADGSDGFRHCESKVKNWASSSIDSDATNDEHTLRDLLFFLHVPRTGGRTYYHCFLKKLYPGSQECPRSYDKLRFNPRKPKCRLLSTHDDYSMMSKLPMEKTSVVTILRNPVDRVFSTYEFSVEVAARFLIHPNLTSVARMSLRTRRKANGISTLDIWPWKYLVPWMREDLFGRRDNRRLKGQTHLVTGNPYQMEDVLMPLHDYINDPIARDVIHNGATFQITGLTNNSCFAEAHEVRHCVLKYNTLSKYVLNVAKKRLDGMLYVGLTENHKESATMFGNIVASQVISQHTSSSNADVANRNDSEQGLESNTNSQEDDQLTVGKLMEAYESCISNLRSSQAERRVNSLKRISPANFTKETRQQVPEVLIEEIMSLNSLDVELYKYAQHIFERQRTHVTPSMDSGESLGAAFSTSAYRSSFYYDSVSWKFLCVCITGLVLLLFILYVVNSRVRRSSKVKM